jgi:hypothetical protein
MAIFMPNDPLVMLLSLLLVPFVDIRFNRKRYLFGHPYPLDDDTPATPNIYKLENILFNQIGFLKVPEFPVDVVFGVIFATLVALIIAYVFYIIMPENRTAISILAALFWLPIVLYRFFTWKTRLS